MNKKKVEAITKAVASAAGLGFLKAKPPQPESFFPGTVAIWCEALADLDIADIVQAFAHVIRRKTSAETYGRELMPGDIRAIIERFASAEYTWQDAWNEIAEKAHQLKYPPYVAGVRQEPVLTYPQTHQVLKQMGGPDFFLDLRTSDTNTAKAQFRNAWTELIEARPLQPEAKAPGRPPVQYIEAPRPEPSPELKAKAADVAGWLASKFTTGEQALVGAAGILCNRPALNAPQATIEAPRSEPGASVSPEQLQKEARIREAIHYIRETQEPLTPEEQHKLIEDFVSGVFRKNEPRGLLPE